jgi:uncharacterized membrane protein
MSAFNLFASGEIDPLWPLLLILRYMHILGALVMMGGAIFLRFALLPTLSEVSEGVRTDLHDRLRQRWSRWVMLGTGLLLISGIANMGLAARMEFSGLLTNGLYNMLLGVKLLLAFPIFFVAALLTGKTSLAKKIQSNRKMWLDVCLALGLTMVLMGGFLRFVKRELKTDSVEKKAAVVVVQADRL